MSLHLNEYIKKHFCDPDCNCIPNESYKIMNTRYKHILVDHVPPVDTIAKLFYVPSDPSLPPSGKKSRIIQQFLVLPEIAEKLFRFNGTEWVAAKQGSTVTAIKEVIAAFHEKRSVNAPEELGNRFLKKREATKQNSNVKKQRTKKTSENVVPKTSRTIDSKSFSKEKQAGSAMLVTLPNPILLSPTEEPFGGMLGREASAIRLNQNDDPKIKSSVQSKNEVDLSCNETFLLLEE